MAISKKKAAAAAKEIVTLENALKVLGTTRSTLYRWMKDGRIKGMKAGRQWRFLREDIERFLTGDPPRFDLPADISPLIKELERKIAECGAKPFADKAASPVQRAVHNMLVLALAQRASDVHISAHMNIRDKPKTGVVRNRIDGVLQVVAEIDIRLMDRIVEEWMRLAGCRPDKKDAPQDGRIVFEETPDGDAVDIRCSFLPSGMGTSVTARIISTKTAVFGLERLGFKPGDVRNIEDAVALPWGLIVFTGFTGSGKTTTAYSCLAKLAGPGLKVLSAEDPIEVLLPWVVQTAINPIIGFNYPEATIMMLRSDPDAIFIGEIRDKQGMGLAMSSALTGHIVMTQLHAGTAVGALKRIIDIGIEPFVAAEGTKLIVAQHLIRRLCPECSKKTTPSKKLLAAAKKAAENGGLVWNKLPKNFRKADGCKQCRDWGYRGRTVVAETLKITRDIAEAIRTGVAAEDIERLAVKGGMTTIPADAVRRAANGETTLDEIAPLLD